MSIYEPGTYVKGDVERVAQSAREAVALSFEGFKLKPVEIAEPEPIEGPVSALQLNELPDAVEPATPTPRAPKRQPVITEDDK